MSAYASTAPRPFSGRSACIYATETKYELLKIIRMPAYVVPTLTFPLLFYIMFGLIFGRQSIGSVTMATYLLATYGVFAVMGASLFGFAVGVSTERGLGWLQVKRASPMPPAAYLLAKTIVSLLFSATVLVALIISGNRFWRRADFSAGDGRTCGHAGRRGASFRRYGTGDRLLFRPQRSAGHCQCGLPSHGILLWIVAAAAHPA